MPAIGVGTTGWRRGFPRRHLGLAVLLVATFGSLLVLYRRAGARGPNVLLISVDSLRADHLGCYGYPRPTSPNIDRLAAEGVRFERALSPSPWTLPAHVTMLSALAPEEHGVIRDFLALREEAVTLAESFREAGYATAAFVAGSYLMRYYGLAQGFDHYDDYTVAREDADSVTRVTSPELVDAALEWISRQRAERFPSPFFVFLHLWDVHYDYVPPAPFDTLFDPDYPGSIDGRGYLANPLVNPDMSPRDLAHVIALYDGEIRFTDQHLGRLLEAMAKLSLLDRTLVAVTADHGEEFFEHGHKGHRNGLYDESILVPLVLRYPRRIPRGRVVRQQVRLADVSPTLLALAGRPTERIGSRQCPVSPGCGKDLSALATAGGTGVLPDDLPAYSEMHGQHAAMRTSRHKLLLRVDRLDRPELYDLLTDPSERENLAMAQPAVRDRLLTQLTGWRLWWHGRSRHALPFQPRPEHLAQLRALGYVE